MFMHQALAVWRETIVAMHTIRIDEQHRVQETWGGYPEGCIQPFSGIYLDAAQSQADPCYQVGTATSDPVWCFCSWHAAWP